MTSVSTITIAFRDARRRVGRVAFNVDDAQDPLAVSAFIDAFTLRMDKITWGVVESVTRTTRIDVSSLALKTSPHPDGDVSEKYGLGLRGTSRVASASMTIPVIARDKVARVIRADYAVLDLLQDEPFEFIQMITDPVGAGYVGGILVDARGEVLNVVTRSKMAYRK